MAQSSWTTRKPYLGQDVLYQTDERNGLKYALPAKITVIRASHPGDYPDGSNNPLPVPESDWHVHLTVFTPGGFGTTVTDPKSDHEPLPGHQSDEAFVGAKQFKPGSGTYVELNVPYDPEGGPRTWRFPGPMWR